MQMNSYDKFIDEQKEYFEIAYTNPMMLYGKIVLG